MQSKNPALAQARRDFTPHIVALNRDAIAALPMPANLGAMRPLLAGTQLERQLMLSAAFLVAMNSLNYQFWDLASDGSMTRYAHEGKVGAVAMQSAFLRAWLDAMPDAHFDPAAQLMQTVSRLRERLSPEGLSAIFGAIPAPASRLAILDEVLNAERLATAAHYLGQRATWEGLLGYGDAQLLAYLFPLGYADPYLKKAQLSLMFLAAEFRAAGHELRELDVSAAADYQLPKVLRALGVLEYAPVLAEIVDAGELLEADGAKERAIRAATVLACDALARHFKCGVEAVDFWLWEQRNAARDAQFHLTVTTHY